MLVDSGEGDNSTLVRLKAIKRLADEVHFKSQNVASALNKDTEKLQNTIGKVVLISK